MASGTQKKTTRTAPAPLVRAGNGRLGQTNGFRQPRVAELLAGALREQILHGERPDGSLLPPQDVMTREFGVSKASLREAMRILESEGLITVRRGKLGGCVVHTPTVRSVGYMLGLVLQANQVQAIDVLEAQFVIEPVCAALCARRPDRHEAVLPALQEATDALAEAVKGESERFVQLERLFHERLVATCGNETIKTVIGTLEALWSEQLEDRTRASVRLGIRPDRELREHVVASHRGIVDAVREGDVDRVVDEMRDHLREFRSRLPQPFEGPVRIRPPEPPVSAGTG